jgi:hypothetical protein
MPTDTQTQAMHAVPTTVVAVREAEAPAPDAQAENARPECVQEMYEAGVAKLNALHDRWAAAVAEIREAKTSSEPAEGAA